MEQRTLERIRQEFQEPDLDGVIELLASFSGPESDRVRWDILELSKGELGKNRRIRESGAVVITATFFIGLSIIRMIRSRVGRDPKRVVEEIIAKWGKEE